MENDNIIDELTAINSILSDIYNNLPSEANTSSIEGKLDKLIEQMKRQNELSNAILEVLDSRL